MQRREQGVRVRRRGGHAQMVRRHAAPLGVQAHLASRTLADRSGHSLRGSGRRGGVQNHRWWQKLAGTFRPAQRQRSSLAARRRGHGPSHDSFGSETPRAGTFVAISAAGVFRTDDCGKTWRADQSRAEVPIQSPTRMRSRPLRPPHRACTIRVPAFCSCRSTGT